MYTGGNVQPQSFQPGSGGQPSAPTEGFAAAVPIGQPELPTPQIANMPPPAMNTPEPQHLTNGPPSDGSPTRPMEYWIAEVEQILNQPDQNPKQRADAIAAVKQHYQQEMLGLNAPGSGGM